MNASGRRRPRAEPATLRPALVFLALTAPAAAAELACDGVPVTVRAGDAATARQVCDMARAAADDLASCNLPLTEPVTIALRDAVHAGCLGLFHCGEGLIDLIAPDRVAENRSHAGLFAPLPDDVLFRAALTHELTHAAYEASGACPFAACPATDEYLAYAMTFRTLPEALRRTVLGEIDATAPVGRDAISPLVALFAPDAFARSAWLHFSQRPDPCGYVGQITAGAIVLDRERP
ncbi:MAG: hypothetical protein NXH83_00500 [Rhodobacteraceae bacterium]|nr:hypothetical protein [Paracoccaceae bacterium]